MLSHKRSTNNQIYTEEKETADLSKHINLKLIYFADGCWNKIMEELNDTSLCLITFKKENRNNPPWNCDSHVLLNQMHSWIITLCNSKL